MIIIDPYEIDTAIADLINQLCEDGRLDFIVPDEAYGYSCEAVFGIRPDQIAAVHLDSKRTWRVRLFQLTDGSLISGDPSGAAARPCLPPTSIH